MPMRSADRRRRPRAPRCRPSRLRCGAPSGRGRITEAEAEALSVLIDGRRSSDAGQNSGQSPNPTATAAAGLTPSPQDRPGRPGVGSRPAHGRLDGAPPPLGRLWPLPPRPRRPVHAGRTVGPRPRGGRGSPPEGLPLVDRERGCGRGACRERDRARVHGSLYAAAHPISSAAHTEFSPVPEGATRPCPP